MSHQPLTCQCGTHINATTTYTGFAYVVQFSDAAGMGITHCPKCDAPLYEALKKGQLKDQKTEHPHA